MDCGTSGNTQAAHTISNAVDRFGGTGWPQDRHPDAEEVVPLLFMAFWLCGWAVGWIDALHDLRKNPWQLFLLSWFAFWTLGGLFVVGFSLRMLAGCDLVTVRGSVLTIRHEIAGIGRTRCYFLPDIRGMRFQPEMGAGKSH